jgi:hypothetical protein
MSRVNAGDFAWSGWRYRIPGGPEGGQYHGYIGPDSSQSWQGGRGGWPGGRSEIAEGPQQRPSGHSLLPGAGSSYGPWDKSWGGTAFTGGQTHSDHGRRTIYRSPSEMRPRANASGGVNVIFGHQEEATPGYGEAPGNYRSLGGVGMMLIHPVTGVPVGVMPANYPRPTAPLRYPVTVKPGPVVYTGPDMWRIGPTPQIPSAGSGATNVVGQPPPPSGPSNVYLVPWSPPPVAPTPAPSVAASPSDFLPSQGQVVDGLTPGTPSAPATSTSFADWMAQSTIFPSIQNQWVVLAGAAAFLMMSGKGKR